MKNELKNIVDFIYLIGEDDNAGSPDVRESENLQMIWHFAKSQKSQSMGDNMHMRGRKPSFLF